MAIENSPSVPPFVTYCAQLIPTVFDNSLSYYEALCALSKWLQANVVEVINNNASVVEEYIALTDELKKYVEDYFDNLDVQEEINNKLDAMAKDGTLTNIIAQYLQLASVLAFDTVADMVASSNLTNGTICRTLGTTNYTTGDGHFYKIRTVTTDDTIDGVNIIALTKSDTLIAELIADYNLVKLNEYVDDNEINVKYNGVAGDGTTDDTTAIQNLINANPHKTLYFPEGEYLISSPLQIYSGNDYQVNLHLDKNAKIKTDTSIEALLIVGTFNYAWERYAEGCQVIIDGGIWYGDNTTAVIKHLSNRKETTFKNITIYNVATYGIDLEIGTSGSSSSDCRILNCNIYGTGSDIGGTALYLGSPDNEIDQLRIGKTKIGIDDEYGGNLISNVHILASYSVSSPNYQLFNACQGLIFGNTSGDSMLNNIYIDDYAQAITITSTRKIKITNLEIYYYTNRSDVTCIAFNVLTNAAMRLTVVNANINMPSSSTNKGLYISSNSFNQYVSVYDSFKFINMYVAYINNAQDQIHNLKFRNDNSFNVNDPWVTTMTQNGYHAFAYINGGYHTLRLQMGNDQIIEAKMNVRQTNPILTVENIVSNAHSGEYSIALCNGGIDEYGNYGAYLCVRSTASNCSYNPCITDGSQGWNTQLRSYRSMGRTALSSPTVDIEKAFN